MRNLLREIEDFAYNLGIKRIGFASCVPLPQFEAWVKAAPCASERLSLFAGKGSRRWAPWELLPGAKTIISAAVPYTCLLKSHLYGHENEPEGTDPFPDKNEVKGFVARFARGPDYHVVVKRILGHLAKFISLHTGARYRIQVDSAFLPERTAATLAGVGWVGKNCCLIVPGYGSWVYLGEIILDLELMNEAQPEYASEPRSELASRERCSQWYGPGDYCGDCTACIDACPTRALEAPGTLNPWKCLSYLTQSKREFPEQFQPMLEGRIYGCDACQEVCPHNQEILKLLDWVSKDRYSLPLGWLINLTKSEFERVFGRTALGWAGLGTIKRNARLAMFLSSPATG